MGLWRCAGWRGRELHRDPPRMDCLGLFENGVSTFQYACCELKDLIRDNATMVCIQPRDRRVRHLRLGLIKLRIIWHRPAVSNTPLAVS